MTCVQCANYTDCVIKSESDGYLDNWMFLVSFWDNADTRCDGFRSKEDNNGLDR